MSRKRHIGILWQIVWVCANWTSLGRGQSVDVLIYGATPAGIAAAIGAAGEDHTIRLIEPTDRIGGMVTSGLSHSDFHSFESLSGSFWQFARRVESDYAKRFGPDSQQVRDSFRGTFGEPHVNLRVFEAMIDEHPSIAIHRGWSLESLQLDRRGSRPQIISGTFRTKEGRFEKIAAKIFIDASYEGDLMANAGVAWRVGREGKDEHDESLAPAMADSQLQAYNFRFCMTNDPKNRVVPQAPVGYLREDFVEILPILESGKIDRVFGYPRKCLFKAQTPPLPNAKYDINDVSQEVVRLSLPGKNNDWPDGDRGTRERIWMEHMRDQAGLLYFLQNDEAVPPRFREEARQWGWCRDEFTETEHLPPQLYVREARRMQGVYVYTQKDSEHADSDARAVLHRDSIAMCDYGNNCHGTFHEGPRFGGKHTGEFYHAVPPYQIPYGVLLPKEVNNLLVPGAVSSSHVGFCSLRLEPVWMALGQAAGHAANLALQQGFQVDEIDVSQLQSRLHRDQSATIYVSDVRPDAPDFAMVQWWGTAGGLHGLAKKPPSAEVRGKKIHGQYSEACPYHTAELHRMLEPSLRQRWTALAVLLQPACREAIAGLNDSVSRGDFLKTVWRFQVSATEK